MSDQEPVELRVRADSPLDGRPVAEVIIDELERTRADELAQTRAERHQPSAAQRRFLDRQMIAEWKRRRRGGTPADAAAQLAAEEKRARRRERNRA